MPLHEEVAQDISARADRSGGRAHTDAARQIVTFPYGGPMIAALFIPAPWPGIVLLGIALALVAICAWQARGDEPIAD